MSGFVEWWNQLQFGGILDTLLVVAASLLCITIHELCHGLVAYKLGDPTAKSMGRLTLNPIAHVDLMGLIMMAVLKFGWAKPVPVDMRYFKNPKWGMALVALAGPVSNVLLALLALVIRLFVIAPHLMEIGWEPGYGVIFLEYVVLISCGLAVFNIIPIPPLDGSKILLAVLPQNTYRKWMYVERYGMILLFALMFLNVLDGPILFLRQGLLDGLQALLEPLTRLVLKNY